MAMPIRTLAEKVVLRRGRCLSLERLGLLDTFIMDERPPGAGLGLEDAGHWRVLRESVKNGSEWNLL